MASVNAAVVNTSTGEVVSVIVVEVEDGVVTTWDGVPLPFGPGFEFDLSSGAQVGLFRTSPGVFGPPPDTRSSEQIYTEAVETIDGLVEDRITSAGFIYKGIRFSSSKEAQISWGGFDRIAPTLDQPFSRLVNNIDDTDSYTFTTATEVAQAYEGGLIQGGAYKQVGAVAKANMRALLPNLSAAQANAIIEQVKATLAVDALDLIAGQP